MPADFSSEPLLPLAPVKGDGGARRDRLRAEGVPVRLERPTGKLRRCAPVPAGCDGNRIRTQFRDGVLQIEVPKIAPATSHPHARR